MVRLWIDTDIGDDIDDAVALLAAARHPEIELVGVSTVFGWVGTRAWLARELLRRAGVNVPVLPGAMTRLTGEAVKGQPGSYNTLAPPVADLSPADDDFRMAAVVGGMHFGAKPFHLVTIGAMTNIAKILALHPQAKDLWLSVTCMAGRLEGDAEWNVHCDPPAAKAVCRHLAPRLVGLEACSDTLPRQEVEELLDPADPASAFLLDAYRAYRGDREDAPLTLFDPISLLSLVAPEAFNLQAVRVAVDAQGRLRLTDDGFPVTYALSSDWGRMKPLVTSLLRGGTRGR